MYSYLDLYPVVQIGWSEVSSPILLLKYFITEQHAVDVQKRIRKFLLQPKEFAMIFGTKYL